MPKKVIHTDRLMRPIAHFSHAARIGNVVHVGATAGVHPDLRLAGESRGRIDATASLFASFNSSGSPCVYSGVLCTNAGSAGFIEYFKDNRIGGSGGWAAISVTPAGRIKRWFWSGSAWTD